MPYSPALPSLLALSKQALSAAIEGCAAQMHAEQANKPQGTPPQLAVVDATCGNGHDTLFLAKLLQSLPYPIDHELLAFDVQKAALTATQGRMSKAQLTVHMSYHNKGHEHLASALSASHRLVAAMYNLGYLPGSDKCTITQSATTLESLQQATDLLYPGGIISVHTYTGHEGGQKEAHDVETWLCSMNYPAWRVARYTFCNKKENKEMLFLLQRQ